MCNDWSTKLKSGLSGSEIITVPPSLFKQHLSRHQEQLALFAITPNLDRELDSEDGSQKSGVSRHNRQEILLEWHNAVEAGSEGSSDSFERDEPMVSDSRREEPLPIYSKASTGTRNRSDLLFPVESSPTTARAHLEQHIIHRQKDDSPEKRIMTRALEQATDATEYDDASMFGKALEAYTNACVLLQSNMARMSNSEDKLQVDAIYSVFGRRAEQLSRLVEKPEESGEKDDITTNRCICGEKNSVIARTLISCDDCGVFQHCICMGVPVAEDSVPEKYLCEQCAPDDHRETIQALERGIFIWHTRKYLHEVGKYSATTHPLLRAYKRNVDAVDSLTLGLRQLERDFVNEGEKRIDRQRMGNVLEESEEDFRKRYQDFRSRLKKRLTDAETAADANSKTLNADAESKGFSSMPQKDSLSHDTDTTLDMSGMESLSHNVSAETLRESPARGSYICSCCPKKPKKFDREEELRYDLPHLGHRFQRLRADS